MNMTGEMFDLDRTYVSGMNLSQILPGQALRRVNTGNLYEDVSSEIAVLKKTLGNNQEYTTIRIYIYIATLPPTHIHKIT